MPIGVVTLAVAWNLWHLKAELLGASYLDDSSVHEQMVRFATAQFEAGHLPLTSWFPYLGLGSPQFLHYQSLPAMLTGILGIAIGPNHAFRWTLYALLSLWPVSIYVSARLFGIGHWAAAASAALSPFLMSRVGIGYEQGAYIWDGYGLWTQLWASFTLPLAWGLSWRAIDRGRGYCAAIALVSVTIALHYETGYLAILQLLLFPIVANGPPLKRARRAAAVLGGSLLAAAWVIVPVLAERPWAATNEILRGSALESGYGAPRLLSWLVWGHLLDNGRLPVVTVFLGFGVVVALRQYTNNSGYRALLLALLGCLVLSFGRATFGSLIGVIPGSADLFFRRFAMGVQLAALLLAGGGAAWCGERTLRLVERLARQRAWWSLSTTLRTPWLRASAALVALIAVAAPAWLQLSSVDRGNAAGISAQHAADARYGKQLDRLIEVIARSGGGRVYAGMPSNWGANFRVGAVPVFKYLDNHDVDEVGYTLRTASLMTDPEFYFDGLDPSDYALFAVHYLIVPAGRKPMVPARRIATAGDYSLWATPVRGYVHIGTVVGTMAADRTDVGTRSIPLLSSGLAAGSAYLRVNWGEPGSAETPRRGGALPPPPGEVVSERDDFADGLVSATVRMRRAGVAVLSASFDPGWHVTVGGRLRDAEMVAPALVATRLAAGTHTVVFHYQGYDGYLVLFLLGASVIAVALLADVRPSHGALGAGPGDTPGSRLVSASTDAEPSATSAYGCTTK